MLASRAPRPAPCWGADGEKRLGYWERGQEAGVDYYEHKKRRKKGRKKSWDSGNRQKKKILTF